MQHCALTGKELQKAFVECFNTKWEEYWADANEIRVGYVSYHGGTIYVSFETWLKLTGNLWSTLTSLPLDVEMETFSYCKEISATLYDSYGEQIQSWYYSDNLSLETIVMQAKVTYTEHLKSIEHNKEECL